jgi:hypothetical protein
MMNNRKIPTRTAVMAISSLNNRNRSGINLQNLSTCVNSVIRKTLVSRRCNDRPW